jgi:hypothetical protein
MADSHVLDVLIEAVGKLQEFVESQVATTDIITNERWAQMELYSCLKMMGCSVVGEAKSSVLSRFKTKKVNKDERAGDAEGDDAEGAKDAKGNRRVDLVITHNDSKWVVVLEIKMESPPSAMDKKEVKSSIDNDLKRLAILDYHHNVRQSLYTLLHSLPHSSPCLLSHILTRSCSTRQEKNPFDGMPEYGHTFAMLFISDFSNADNFPEIRTNDRGEANFFVPKEKEDNQDFAIPHSARATKKHFHKDGTTAVALFTIMAGSTWHTGHTTE